MKSDWLMSAQITRSNHLIRIRASNASSAAIRLKTAVKSENAAPLLTLPVYR